MTAGVLGVYLRFAEATTRVFPDHAEDRRGEGQDDCAMPCAATHKLLYPSKTGGPDRAYSGNNDNYICDVSRDASHVPLLRISGAAVNSKRAGLRFRCELRKAYSYCGRERQRQGRPYQLCSELK